MALSRQTNIAVNTNKSQVYFEDSASPLSYNFKTDQWTRIPDYGGISFYDVLSGLNIGLVRISGTAVDLQQPTASDPPLTASIITGESTFSDGSRRIITGVRPLLTANDAKVSIFTRDTLNPSTRTNYFLHTEDFSNAAWTKTGTSITADQATAPDGSLGADTMECTDGGPTGVTQTTQNLGSAGDDFVVSVYLKYIDHPYVRINLEDGSVDYISFDIQNGVVKTVGIVAGNIQSYGIESADQGFYRCYLVLNGHSDSTPNVDIQFANAAGGSSAISIGVSCYIWGAMAEATASLRAYFGSEATVGTTTLDQTTEATINSRSGVANFRAESRYHRVKLRVPSGFTTILGCDVEFEPSGEI